jgi:hypothetical protein
MRHALVPVHLMNSARSVAASARHDAGPEPADLATRPTRRARRTRSARRVATRTRRTRA